MNTKDIVTIRSARITFWRPWLGWLAWLVNLFSNRLIVVRSADGAYQLGLEKLNNKVEAAVVELTLRLLEIGPTTGGVEALRGVARRRRVAELALELAYVEACRTKGKPSKLRTLCAEIRKDFKR